MYVTIAIGNTDDKLSQAEWSRFVQAVNNITSRKYYTTHFFGCPSGDKPWQNACWLIELLPAKVKVLRGALRRVGRNFKQESIFIAAAVGELVVC